MIRMRRYQFGLIASEDRRVMTHSFVEELLEKAVRIELNVMLSNLIHVRPSTNLSCLSVKAGRQER